MPTYEIYRKDGTPVKVKGPEGASTKELVNLYLQEQREKTQRTARERDDLLYERILEAARQKPSTIADQTGEVFKGLGSGVAGLLEQGALGAATVLPESVEAPVRDRIKKIGGGVQDFLAPDINIGIGATDVPRKFSEALGSFGGILGASIINPVAGGALAVGAGAGEASERAREAGATEQQRAKSALFGAGVGLSELIPLERLKSVFRQGIGAEGTRGIINRGRRILEQAGIEGVQEYSAAVAQNLIERGVYNPEQGKFEGANEALGYGAGVGGFVQAIADMIAPRRGAKADDTKTDDKRSGASLEDDTQRKELDTKDRKVADAVEEVTTTRVDPAGTVAGPNNVGEGEQKSALEKKKEAEEKYPGLTPAGAKVAAKFDEQDISTTDTNITPEIRRAMKANGLDIPKGMTKAEAVETLREKGTQPAPVEKKVDVTPKTDAKKKVEEKVKKIISKKQEEGVVDLKTLTPDPKEGEVASIAEEMLIPDETEAKAETKTKTKTKTKKEEKGPEAGFVDTTQAPATETTATETTVDAETQLAEGLGATTTLDAYQKSKTDIRNEFKPRFKELDDTFTPQIEQVTKEKGGKSSEAVALREQYNSARRTLLGQQTKAISDAAVKIRKSKEKPKFFRYDPKERPEALDIDKGVSREDVKKQISRIRDTAASKAKRQEELADEVKIREQKNIKQKELIDNLNKSHKAWFDQNASDDAAIIDKYYYSAAAIDENGGFLDSKDIEDNTTPKDKAALVALATGQTKVKDKDRPAEAAQNYFQKYSNTSYALEVIAYDLVAEEVKVKKEKDPKTNRIIKNPLTGKAEIRTETIPLKKYRPTNEFFQINRFREADKDGKYKGMITQGPLSEANIMLLSGEGIRRNTGQDRAENAAKWIEKNAPSAYETLKKLQAIQRNENNRASSDANSDSGILNTLGTTRIETDADGNPYIVAKDNFFKVPTNHVIGMGIRFHPDVRALLKAGDLKKALEYLGKRNENGFIPARITKLATLFANKIGTTKIVLNSNLPKDTAGLFDPKTNTIELHPDRGMNPHVLIHEATHALTSATLAQPSNVTTKQLNTLFNDVKESLDTAYGSKNLDEFVAEALANQEFRSQLAGITPKGRPLSALKRFNNILANMLRRLLGEKLMPLQEMLRTDTALNTIDPLIESILEPAPSNRNAAAFRMASDQVGVSQLLKDLGKQAKDKAMTKVEKNAWLDGFSEIVYKLKNWIQQFVLGFTDSLVAGDLADRNGFKGLGADLNDALLRQRGGLDDANRKFDDAIRKVLNILKKNDGMEALLNDLIYDETFGATIWQIDPTAARPKDADLASRYDKQQEIIKKLNTKFGKDKWKDVYDTQKKYYEANFDQLQNILFGRIESELDGKSATKIKSIFQEIFDRKELKVYFPLIRQGTYKISYIAKDAKARGLKDPLVVEMVSTINEQNRRVDEIKAQGLADGEVKVTDTQSDFNKYIRENAPPTSFVRQVMDIIDQSKIDKKQSAALKESVGELFINALPETSYAKSLQRRTGNPGHGKNMLEAFRVKGFNLGRDVVKLKFSAEISGIEADINAIATENGNNKYMQNLARELILRSKFARQGANYKELEKWFKNANQGAFLYTIGFNVSSAIVNLSQIPLFVYPYLGAEYGLANAGKAISNAYRRVANSKNSLDNYFEVINGQYVLKKDLDVSPEEAQELKKFATLVEVAQSRGQLTRSFMMDALGLDEAGRRKTGDWRSLMNNTVAISAIPFNQAERLNRQVTLMAAYDLALQDGKLSERDAAFKALRQTQETNGGAVLETAPRWAQQGLGRVALMYKSYGIRMYTTMIQTSKEYLDNMFAPVEGETTQEREERLNAKRIARNKLIGVHASALLFAGAQGIPLYGAFEVISNLFFLDDEEEDFDSIVRSYIGEQGFKGAVNSLTGVDVATRIRLTGLLLNENRYNKDASLEESLFFYFGGPAFSTVKRIEQGFKDASDGKVERSIENFLPPGIANIYKTVPTPISGRLTREGYETRRGDPIFDDVTGGDLAGILFGFPPVEYTNTMEKNNIKKGIDTAVNKKKSKILKQYYVAARTGNTELMNKALKDLLAHNKRHPLSAITGDSISKSMKRHIEQSKNIRQHNGVSISSGNKNLITMHERQFDEDYTFFD
tara:strand:+ start:10197 stop:16607 length:6411 start_codon:yes stop_codon:yes gene_type:complete